MENNNNIEVEEIMEKELDIFNISWNTLNSNCKVLEEYSTFIQKYLDVMNQYYMSLTELNSEFPNFFSESYEFNYESSIKNISKILSSSIQIQLNNLLIFLSESQALIHSLNKVIAQCKKFIQFSKKINENIFSKIKSLYKNYHKEYLSMIDSFENLEKKLIKNYIKNHYNIGEEINENDLKNCVEMTKKKENSLINFNKDEIKNDINEFNKNMDNIRNNRNDLIKSLYECIFSIINNLSIYINNLLIEINNEKDLNSNYLNENDENEEIFDFQITEKEANSIIFNLFNSKKYNIKILKNEIINYSNPNNSNELDKVENSKFLLSEGDIFNIIKEIYNYDFISLNTSEYDLEIEKEKLKILDLTKKLLSYDFKLEKMEIITDDEIKILNNMLNDNEEYILYFLSVLNLFRTKGIYEMPKRVFDTITNIFQQSLKTVENNKNIEIGEEIVILSFSFFKIEGKERYYFGDIIKNDKFFKSSFFWKDYITNQIEKDLKRIHDDGKKMNEDYEKNMDVILLSKILPSADTMSKFGFKKENIIKIIEPLMDQYEMNPKSKESLLSLVNNQI